MRSYLANLKWPMIIWCITAPVVVWLLGAPAWVAGVLCIWLLYKETE